MSFLQPKAPPYDPYWLMQQPFAERARWICQTWAIQGYGAPQAVVAFYALKIGFYVAMWLLFCAMTPALGSPLSIGSWWLTPLAFQKAVLWSMLFEGLGLGCGSGPLTGRYYPPFGGFLYFLRTGTTKLALWPSAPVIGGVQRSWLDVALYAALLLSLLRALLAPSLDGSLLWPIVILLPLVSIGDRMMFLVFRGEHYWTLVCCFALTEAWVGPAKLVWLALWFWAGFSKLNHHFPAVVCVMTSNSPLSFRWLRERLYRRYPEDLTPSRLAHFMAHAGTVLEFSVPVLMLLAPVGELPVAGIVAMLLLHGFITSNVPMGVPLEWNVMMVYGAFALFWAHPGVAPFAVGDPLLVGVLAVMLVALPLLGNLFPHRVSFLLSMRYYAGNWACSFWFCRLDALPKFDKLKRVVETVDKQLARFYDPKTVAGLFTQGIAFRLMHLHGRALVSQASKAMAPNEQFYTCVDGEGIAGIVLGWNFGDGHLHDEGLMRAVQAQCGFEPGELRGLFVESQPLGRQTLSYRLVDAAAGPMESGELAISALRAMQPWGAESPPAVSGEVQAAST